MTGDGRASFDRLVREHHAAVWRSAWRIVRDDDDASDVAQEVFLRLLRRSKESDELARAESPERVLRWLAVKSALAHLRGERNRRRREERSAMNRPERSDERGAAGPVQERELAEAARRAVAELPDELRLAATLRFQEGLTFAQVGDCLGIAEPTAHERVKRALEKLRSRLTQLGFAGALGSGGGVDPLASTAALEKLAALEESAAVPASLAPKLLALGAAGAGKSMLPLAAAALLVLGGGAIALREALRPEPAASLETAGAATPDEPAAATTATSDDTAARRDAEPRDEIVDRDEAGRGELATTQRHGTLVGNVRDAEGRPVVGAQLRARSTWQQKGGEWGGDAVTDSGGAFDMTLPIVVAAGEQRYTLTIAHDDFLEHRVEPFVLEAGGTTDLGALVVRRNAADRAGDYTLAAVVEDGAGRPVPGAWVRLHRELAPGGAGAASDASEESVVGPWEAGAQADGAGVARMSGKRIGRKTLVIDARHLGFRLLRRSIEVEWTGFEERRFALEPGLSIAGRLRFPAGVDVATIVDETNPNGPRTQVYAIGSDPNEWMHAALRADGSFRIVGLDPGRYALHVRSPFSPAKLDVEAGAEDVTIELKRPEDVGDAGAHMGEIHGRLVDAASGAEVIAQWDQVECEPVDDAADEAALREDVLPRLASPPIRQTSFDPSFVEPAPSAEFHLTGLEDHRFVVVARVPGYAASFSGAIRIEEQALVRDVVIRLERPASVRARIVDAEGRPVAGAFVVPIGVGPRSLEVLAALEEQVRAEPERPFLFISVNARSDADGRVELAGLPPQLPCALGVLHPDFLSRSGGALTLAAGKTADAGEIRLTPRSK
jgi:RNA polymerase sigma-70 factor (ECF subfamily)